MVPGKPSVGTILCERKIITEAQLQFALKRQLATRARLGEVLVELGYASDEAVARALAEQLELPFVDLSVTPPDPQLANAVPRELALEYGVVPVRMENQHLLVVARDPTDIRVDEAVRASLRCPVLLAAAPDSQIRRYLRQYYGLGASEDVAPGNEVVELNEADTRLPLRQFADADHASPVSLLSAVLGDAVRRGAAEVLFEPSDAHVRLRYRLSDSVRPVLTLSRGVFPPLLSRVKAICGMDLAEARRPQSGGCRVRIDGRLHDVRAATLPTVQGEALWLRLLHYGQSVFLLDQLGLREPAVTALRRQLEARAGLLLLAGPAGAGSTAAYYALLQELPADRLSVISLEDPVEFRVTGIHQVALHPTEDLHFAAALQQALRLEPDVIALTDVPDARTAELVCRAALSGRLVIAALPAASAAEAPYRLVELGVPPYRVAAATAQVLGQRWLHRVCARCAQTYTPAPALARALAEEFGEMPAGIFRRGAGCEACQHMGSDGMLGVFELLEMTGDLRRVLPQAPTPAEFEAAARQHGFQPLSADALEKARAGLLAPEELLRVARGGSGICPGADVRLPNPAVAPGEPAMLKERALARSPEW